MLEYPASVSMPAFIRVDSRGFAVELNRYSYGCAGITNR
jgi:hypothetical protein